MRVHVQVGRVCSVLISICAFPWLTPRYGVFARRRMLLICLGAAELRKSRLTLTAQLMESSRAFPFTYVPVFQSPSSSSPSSSSSHQHAATATAKCSRLASR
ncbi:hypothetical protein V8C43DRAFT_74967 [Trichoderma afarasin]